MNKNGIIYKWTCLDTGKSYIGQTVTPNIRFRTHLRNGLEKETNHPLYIDMNKYVHWSYTVLEEDIPRGEELNNKEMFYIKKYNTMYPNGYNLRKGASFKGITINYSQSHKDALKDSWTDERKQKASETQKIAQKNYWSTPEGKEKAKHHSEVMKGRKQTEESNKKRSESLKGHETSIETRKKIGDANRNRQISEETRKKQRESHLGHAPGNKGKHKVWDNKELNKFHYE